jgi:predicted HicB family RNase H-like nuclease
MKISKTTGIPNQIPSIASEKLNLRVTPATKQGIRNLSQEQKKSMSKVVLRMIDFYLNTIGIEEPNQKHLCW